MPLENLDEEGLPKNPDLRIAQLKFLLSLPEHRRDVPLRTELMEADGALTAFRKTYDKTVALGHRLDIVFYLLRIGLFYMDNDLITRNTEKARSLIEEGGDWDRRNRLKVYQGLYCVAIRDFKQAADLFLDTVSTFTSYELMDYKTFVTYTVYVSMIALDRPDLREKVRAQLMYLPNRCPLMPLLGVPLHYLWSIKHRYSCPLCCSCCGTGTEEGLAVCLSLSLLREGDADPGVRSAARVLPLTNTGVHGRGFWCRSGVHRPGTLQVYSGGTVTLQDRQSQRDRRDQPTRQQELAVPRDDKEGRPVTEPSTEALPGHQHVAPRGVASISFFYYCGRIGLRCRNPTGAVYNIPSYYSLLCDVYQGL
ncbi:hypothetical protein XELAEV_18026021mg [Xenopus laevis]|uniref:26S proteasome regulatory subunit Rpn7 N-terminal domain-containing protein n=1 Tax=Xenopus laevis TaxID=8355 RepID=A0A974HMF5_XENLA|nr:hypothetical protein XELAEV_18026021mg [Xenopus laevis]